MSDVRSRDPVRRYPFKILAATVTVVACSFAISRAVAAVDIPPQFSDAVRIMEEERADAERWVRTIRVDFGPEVFQYRRAKILYDQAASSFNALIKQVEFDLRAKIRVSESKEFWPSLQRAAEKNARFLDYATKLYNVRTNDHGDIIEVRRRYQDSGGLAVVLVSESSASIPDLISKVVTKIVRAITIVYETLREVVAEEDREELLGFIGGLHWKYFEDI